MTYTKKVYLDNNASTKPSEEAIKAFIEYSENYYGNPSSSNLLGVDLDTKYREIKKEFLKLLDATGYNIIFTSGATESNNIVIDYYLKYCLENNKKVFCSKVEHSSVLKLYKKYEKEGLNVTYLNADNIYDGLNLSEKLKEEFYFGSCMSYNNETGIKSEIEKIRNLVGVKTIIHSDSTQEIGKVYFSASKNYSDIYTFSGHKFHSVKGVGGILYKKEIKLEPQQIGGGQENGLRPGTTNLPAIYSMYVALKEAYDNSFFKEKIIKIRDEFEKLILNEVEEVEVINKRYSRLDNTTYLRIKGVNTDVLVSNLNNISISNGSACNSYAPEISHVAREIMSDKKSATEVVRVCFSRYNKIDEINYVVSELKKEIMHIRLETMKKWIKK